MICLNKNDNKKYLNLIKQYKEIEMLPTIVENEIIDYSDLSRKMLNEEMDNTVDDLNKEFLDITQRMNYINKMFEKSYLQNKNNEVGMSFLEHELLEERMDGLFYRYQKTKELLKKGRLIRYYKEQKDKEKTNELRYARNTLAYYGINVNNQNM